MTTHCAKCGHPMVANSPTGDEHRRQRRTGMPRLRGRERSQAGSGSRCLRVPDAARRLEAVGRGGDGGEGMTYTGYEGYTTRALLTMITFGKLSSSQSTELDKRFLLFRLGRLHYRRLMERRAR